MITTEHVRELVAAPDGDRVLVVLGGRAHVVTRAELDTDRYRGALEVVTAADLADRVSGSAGDEELRALADTLDTEVRQLGG